MDFDLFVIGAGSGGVRAARIAAAHGAKVAIAEEHRYGGTCVIRGCIPKKLFVYASEMTHHFEDARSYGWTAAEPGRFDWNALLANKDKEIARLSGLYEKTLRTHNVTMYNGRAHLSGPNTVCIGDDTVSARYILVATGGTPWMPEIPGAELAISSNEAFHLDHLPPRITVVGGGYIAIEFAGIFRGMGSQVCLVHRRDKVLRGFDEDVRRVATQHLSDRGIDLVVPAEVTGITQLASGELAYTLNNGNTRTTDAIMFATGRVPNSGDLGLEKAGVKLGKRDAIAVDAYSQTSAENIYAVGDVTDRLALTPVAIREGHAFADSVFGGNRRACEHSLVPTAVFSQPTVAAVGLTEAEARAAHGDVDIYRSEFRPLKQTLTPRTAKTLVKLVVSRDHNRVVGLHMVGDGAAEIVQAAAIAIHMGATKEDFDATVALHPTTAEELVLMRTAS